MSEFEEKVKRRNLLLRVAKYGENYYPIKKSSEMPVGKFYQVQSGILKETKFGQKVALIIIDDLKEYIVYVGDYATNKSKLDAIVELLQDDDIVVYIAVESYEERTSNSSLTTYDYSVVEKKNLRKCGEAEETKPEEEDRMNYEEEFLDAQFTSTQTL